MTEYIRSAFLIFKQNKIRTILSLMGVIMGSAFTVASALSRTSGNIQTVPSPAKLDIINISPDGAKHTSARVLDYDERFRKELAAIDHVKNVFFTNRFAGTITQGNISVNMDVICSEYGYAQSYGAEIQYGRDFSVSDHVMGNQKLIMGSKIAEALFPDGNPAGAQVVLAQDSALFKFEVIGVFAPSLNIDDSLPTAVMAPRGFYLKKINPNQNADSIQIQIDNAKNSPVVEAEIRSLIREKTGSETTAWITTPASAAEQIRSAQKPAFILSCIIIALLFLVGGVGILNIMNLAAADRRDEILINIKQGTPVSSVRNRFLAEAAAIALLGGFAGIAAGTAAGAAIQVINGIPPSAAWPAYIAALAYSAGTGLIFGIGPALKAAGQAAAGQGQPSV